MDVSRKGGRTIWEADFLKAEIFPKRSNRDDQREYDPSQHDRISLRQGPWLIGILSVLSRKSKHRWRDGICLNFEA